MKLSVTVAIYNVKNYLRQCIDSVLAQSFTDFELILVDDGSTDECVSICDEYAAKDSRVRVIHQKNAGLVEARKTGLRNAHGEYISFIDGDDFMEADFYEKMMKQVDANPGVDMVCAAYVEDNGREVKEMKNWSAERSIKSTCLYSGTFYVPGIWASFWTKLYRREFLEEIKIDVDPGIRMGEDAAFTYPAVAMAKSVVVDNDNKSYHYRTEIAEGSMSKSFDPKYFERIKILIDNMQQSLEKTKNESILRQFDYYILNVLFTGMLQMVADKKSDTKQIKKVCRDFDVSAIWNRVDKQGFSKVTRICFRLLSNGYVRIFVCLKKFQFSIINRIRNDSY